MNTQRCKGTYLDEFVDDFMNFLSNGRLVWIQEAGRVPFDHADHATYAILVACERRLVALQRLELVTRRGFYDALFIGNLETIGPNPRRLDGFVLTCID